MPKQTTPTASPKPEITGPEEAIQTVQAMSEDEAAKVTSISASRKFRRFGQRDATVSKVAAGKVQLIQEARKAFHEAATLAGKGEDQEAKAVEISNRGGLLLAQGRISGVLSQPEVSDVLGSEFGWKGKGSKVGQRVTTTEPDATRSATPYGLGNQIRQRVVRAVNAYLFTHGQEDAAGRFFDGLEPETVAPLVNETLNNNGSLWTLYTKLADAKSQATGQRPKDAFNPKKVAAMVATLGENMSVTVEHFVNNPGLFEAYDSLYRMLGEIDRSLPDESESNAA